MPREDALPVSVIVPTINRGEDVLGLASRLAAVDTTGVVELIIVDDFAATPVESDVISAIFERASVIRTAARCGPSIARSIGARAATGDVLVWFDDDTRPEPEWFIELQKYLAHGVCAGTGFPLPTSETTLVARQRAMFYEARYAKLADGAPVRFLAGHNAFTTRACFDGAGGFPQLAGSSDVALAERLAQLNTPVRYAPKLRVSLTLDRGVRQVVLSTFRSGLTSQSSPRAFVTDELRKLRNVRRGLKHDAAATACSVGFQSVRWTGYLVGSIRRIGTQR